MKKNFLMQKDKKREVAGKGTEREQTNIMYKYIF